jgi:hypothetical protein
LIEFSIKCMNKYLVNLNENYQVKKYLYLNRLHISMMKG